MPACGEVTVAKSKPVVVDFQARLAVLEEELTRQTLHRCTDEKRRFIDRRVRAFTGTMSELGVALTVTVEIHKNQIKLTGTKLDS